MISADGLKEDATEGGSNRVDPAIEDRGVAGNDNGTDDARLPASPSQSEGEPESHCGTQVDANVDSQLTTVDDDDDGGDDGDDSQPSDHSVASGTERPALDFYSIFRSF